MTAAKQYRLDPVSLQFSDKDVENDYQHGNTLTISASVKPLVWMLLPFVMLVCVAELTRLFDTPVQWWTAAWLAVALGLLGLISTYTPRLVEVGVVCVFVVFDMVLLAEVSNDEELLQFLPGLLMVVILTHCVGLGFRISSASSMALLASQMGYVLWTGIDINIYLDAMTFLIPGSMVAAAAGYTMERQRRHLFLRVMMTRAERDHHEAASMHDPLTRLPNRTLLAERFAQSLARCKRQDLSFAVMFIDLDDFKQINDTYDHAAGDEVLKGIARSLQDCVRGEDTVARMGGDEFVVLSEEVRNEPGAVTAAERILQAIARPIKVDDQEISVKCSIGVAICPKDGEDLDDLILKADKAMYAAKQDGKGKISTVPVS